MSLLRDNIERFSGVRLRTVLADEIDSRLREVTRPSSPYMNMSIAGIIAEVAVEASVMKLEEALMRAVNNADAQLLEAAALHLMALAIEKGLK